MKHSHTTAYTKRQKARERRRLRAGRLFAKGVPQAEVARRLGVTPAAVSQWHAAWKKDGLAGLKSKGNGGPSPKLTVGEKADLRRLLRKRPSSFGYTTDFWTLERIAEVIHREMGVRYHPGHVWKLLRADLGFSWQKPEARARERDEAVIRRWVREEWPRVEKRGVA